MEGRRGRERRSSRWRLKISLYVGRKSPMLRPVVKKRVIGARRCEDNRRKSLRLWRHCSATWVSIVSNVRVCTVRISLPIADTVVLLSVKKTKRHFSRPPPVCPPPLSGLCWFNPGGQQPGLTAPRHCHVIYGSLWERRGDDHSDLTPAILSATHQEADNTQTYRHLLIQTLSHGSTERS